MKFLMTYSELEQFLADKVSQPLSFEQVDAKTLRVTTEVNAFFIRKKLHVDVKIEELSGTDLRLSFGEGLMTDLLLKGVMKIMQEKLPEAVVEEAGNGRVVVHLAANEQLQKALEQITLQEVSMTSDGVEVLGMLHR